MATMVMTRWTVGLGIVPGAVGDSLELPRPAH
jgi:hypothetical protein